MARRTAGARRQRPRRRRPLRRRQRPRPRDASTNRGDAGPVRLSPRGRRVHNKRHPGWWAWGRPVGHTVGRPVGLGGRVGRAVERRRRSSARGQSRAVRGVVRERRRARGGRVHGPCAVARRQRGGWSAPRVAEREARSARGTVADAPVSGVSRKGEDVEGFHPRLHDGGARCVAALRGGDGREARDRSGVSGRLAVAEGVRADRGAV